jgi:dTDP-glucose 4,6-dehydratase
VVEPEIFIQISTDEVYGPAPDDYSHKEWDAFIPSNPYSASKAAQEAIAISYWRTYGMPVVITNTMNMIGEMQDSEKFVPMVIKRVLNGEVVTIHASSGPERRIGSRFYLHARNLADACMFLLRRGERAMYSTGADRPDKWHVVGERELTNLEMAVLIQSCLSDEFGRYVPLKVEYQDFHGTRPGHDLRYALDGTKIAEAGWTPPISLESSLRKTIRWTLENELWSKSH